MITLRLNGEVRTIHASADTPLLWVLRDELNLTGTKFGCGAALCGACTVHVDGVAMRSCVLAVASVADREVTTIEGLSPNRSHPLQRAWIAENVPQCGYCQSGQLMSAAALLRAKPVPEDADIDVAMAGNICRCGTYQRIRKAIHRAAADTGAAPGAAATREPRFAPEQDAACGDHAESRGCGGCAQDEAP